MSGVSELEYKFKIKIDNVVGGNIVLKHYVNFLDSLSVRTKYTYVCMIKAFLQHVDKRIEELEFDDFNDYMSSVKYMDNHETKTSSYLITVYSSLKKFCEYLYISKKINENYMLSIKRPKAIDKQKTIQKREVGYLNEREIKRLIINLDADLSTKRSLAEEWKLRNKAIIYTFLYTGIRCSALCSIDIDDIDFDEQVLIVTDKGSKTRKFDLTDDFCEILKEWIEVRNNMDLVYTNALFISNRRKRITNQAVALMVKEYADLIGVGNKNITPHKLRATYGTQLYNKTGDIYFVQECMGHNSTETTQRYIRGDRKNSKRAADIMKGIL